MARPHNYNISQFLVFINRFKILCRINYRTPSDFYFRYEEREKEREKC